MAERQPKMRLEPHRLVFIDETGASTTQGAVNAPQRSPATKVWVFQWPKESGKKLGSGG
jgi:hypothetical protein